jgi:four helix bundle protein
MEHGKKITGFEDLVVWQQALTLSVAIYQAFEACRDFALKNQIQRAAISISSNIAEGYERGSNKEFIQFLYYAKGSCGEVRSQTELALRVNLLSNNQAAPILASARLLSGKLGAYIKVRETKFS